jgi:hypothetical protein
MTGEQKRQMEKSIRMTSKDKANAQKALEKRQAIFKKTIQGIAYESKVVQTELREVVGTVRDALRARERKGAMLGGRSGLLLSWSAKKVMLGGGSELTLGWGAEEVMLGGARASLGEGGEGGGAK